MIKPTHIFGKVSRKQAVKDAAIMQNELRGSHRTLARYVFALKYMGRAFDALAPSAESQKVLKEVEEILSGGRDEEILKEAFPKEGEEDGASKEISDNDTARVREPMPAVLSTEEGESRARGESEGEGGGPFRSGSESARADERNGENLL